MIIAICTYYLNDYATKQSAEASTNILFVSLAWIGGPSDIQINFEAIFWSALEPVVTFIVNSVYEELVSFLINRLEYHQ